MSNEAIYYNLLLIIVLMLPLIVVPTTRNNQVVDVPKPLWGGLLVFFAMWCMASVPVVLGTWTDRAAYGSAFVTIARDGIHTLGAMGEPVFEITMWLVSRFTSDLYTWFYVTALLYVGNYYIVANRLTKEYSFILFLSMLCCFQFLSYGYNTIRAGFAGSFVLLGLTYCRSLWRMAPFFIVAFFCHKSMVLPLGALLFSYYAPVNTKWYVRFWLLCIVVSFFAGSSFEGLLSGLIEDKRAHYFQIDAAQTVYKVGFRWDFLFYSSLPVVLGHYYINVLNFKSAFYKWIYSAYLIANSFWVLVIRAEYTDRFAYLSWFLFPLLLMYPLLTQQFYRDVNKQKSMIVWVLMGQFAFTYYMYLAYNGFKPF